MGLLYRDPHFINLSGKALTEGDIVRTGKVSDTHFLACLLSIVDKDLQSEFPILNLPFARKPTPTPQLSS